jgi:hypothetical protein
MFGSAVAGALVNVRSTTMSIDLMRSLLRDFGGSIGLPELAPDDDGYCCLRIGDKVTVSLQYEPESQDLVLFARLCRIPREARLEAYEMMLQGNLFWGGTQGGTLAVEPSDGVVFLLMKEKIRALEFASFGALLDSFATAGEYWLSQLELVADEIDDEAPGLPAGEGLTRI